MYGKIFASMFKGSLYGQWEAIVTFTVMIVLADQYGEVDMTPEALAASTSIPLDIIRKGIADLEKPDPKSRTPDEEGRRIVRVSEGRDWGWRITNYDHYRKIRSAEERREYMKQYQRDRRAVGKPESTAPSTPVNNVTDAVSSKQEVEVETELQLPTHAQPLESEFEHADHAAAYVRFRATAKVPASVDAALRGVARPMTGNRVPYPWPVIGAALVELEAKDGKFGTEAVRAFCRKILATDLTPARTNGKHVTIAMTAEEIEADRQARIRGDVF